MESFLNSFLQPVVDFANDVGHRDRAERSAASRIAIMVILLLGTGLYLTVRTGFVQFTRPGSRLRGYDGEVR